MGSFLTKANSSNARYPMPATTLRSARLQLERVRRHYDPSMRTYDEISFLDLTHALRTWLDLKGSLESAAPRLFETKLFSYGVPTKKAMRTVRGHEYVIAHMPGGVLTFACHGDLASWRGGFSKNCAVAARIKRNENGSWEFASYGFCDQTPEGRTHLEEVTISRGNFKQWLDSEAVRVAVRDDEKVLAPPIGIGRETLIRRVANILGASHPVSEHAEANSPFDPAVKYLLRHNVAGVPLPYLLMLKAAQDLLAIAPGLLPDE